MVKHYILFGENETLKNAKSFIANNSSPLDQYKQISLRYMELEKEFEKFKEISKKLTETLTIENEELESKNSKLNSEVERIKNEITFYIGENEELKKKIKTFEDESKELDFLRKECEFLRSDILENNEKIKILEEENKERVKKLEEENKKMKNVDSKEKIENQELKSKNGDLIRQLEVMNKYFTDYMTLEEEISVIKKTNQIIREEKDALKKELEVLKTMGKSKEQEYMDILSERKSLPETILQMFDEKESHFSKALIGEAKIEISRQEGFKEKEKYEKEGKKIVQEILALNVDEMKDEREKESALLGKGISHFALGEYEKGLEIFKNDLIKNHYLSQYYHGISHFFGHGGVEKNSQMGIKYFKDSMDQGFTRSKLNYAISQLKSRPVEAMSLLREVAKQGLSEAIYILGKSYFNGEYIEKDKVQGARFLLEATGKGNKEALKEYIRFKSLIDGLVSEKEKNQLLKNVKV